MEPTPEKKQIPHKVRLDELEKKLDNAMSTDLKALDIYLSLGALVMREVTSRYPGPYHEEIELIGLRYYQVSQGK